MPRKKAEIVYPITARVGGLFLTQGYEGACIQLGSDDGGKPAGHKYLISSFDIKCMQEMISGKIGPTLRDFGQDANGNLLKPTPKPRPKKKKAGARATPTDKGRWSLALWAALYPETL